MGQLNDDNQTNNVEDDDTMPRVSKFEVTVRWIRSHGTQSEDYAQ